MADTSHCRVFLLRTSRHGRAHPADVGEIPRVPRDGKDLKVDRGNNTAYNILHSMAVESPKGMVMQDVMAEHGLAVLAQCFGTDIPTVRSNIEQNRRIDPSHMTTLFGEVAVALFTASHNASLSEGARAQARTTFYLLTSPSLGALREDADHF